VSNPVTQLAEVLGIIGSVLAATMAFPQAVRAWRRGVEGVSHPTFQILMATAISWAVYGAVRELWVLCVGNIILACSCLAVLLAFLRAGTSLWHLVRILVPAAAFVFVVMFIEPAWSGLVAAAYSIGLRFPQLRLLRHASSIAGISVGTWIVAATASFCWVLYAVIKGDVILGVSTSINTVTSVTLIISVFAARRRFPASPPAPDPADVPFLEPLPE
jgi:uncharacterized protein with PQ loop repeat